MAPNRNAVRWCLLSILSLVAGCVIGAFFPHLLVAGVAAGFMAYVVCGRCAMAEWHANDRVFTTRPRIEDHRRRPRTPVALASAVVLAAVASAPRPAANARPGEAAKTTEPASRR